MRKELHIVLQEVIKDLGINTLKSSYLVNILQDYGAFGIYGGKDPKKEIISTLASEKYVKKLLRWKKRKKHNWERDNEKYIEQFKKGHDYDNILVDNITDAFVIAIGLPQIIDSPKKLFKPFSIGKRKKKIVHPSENEHTRQKCSFRKILWGEKIELDKDKKTSIIVGSVIELLVITLCLFADDESFGIFFILFILALVQLGYVLIDWQLQKSGISISIAFLTGEFLTILLFCILIPSVISYNGSDFYIYYIYLCCRLAIMFCIARFTKKPRLRLFGFTSLALSFLLLVFLTPPLIIKHNVKHNILRQHFRATTLYDIHMRETAPIGFMECQLNDSYQSIKKMINNDTNIRVINSKKSKNNDYTLPVEWIDIDAYQEFGYIQKHIIHNIPYDKELQYTVKINNDSTLVKVLFINDSAKIIQLYHIDQTLYNEKYGEPEMFYDYSPSNYEWRLYRYPWFRKKKYPWFGKKKYPRFEHEFDYDYSHHRTVLQWSFANGTIRMNAQNIYYISNNILTTIEDTEIKKRILQKEANERIERQQIEEERKKERERLQLLEQEKLEKQQKKKARDNALQQI